MRSRRAPSAWRLVSIAAVVGSVGIFGAAVSDASGPRANAGIAWAGSVGIMGANIDGSNRKLVATDRLHPDGYFSPSWSSGGRVLAFTSCASDGCGILINVPATGKTESLYIRSAYPPPGRRLFFRDVEPSWAPDGQHLAYADVWGSRQSIIQVVSLQTNRASPLTRASERRADRSPAWSPAGGTIAFVRRAVNAVGARLVEGEPFIQVARADGSGLRRLTRGTSPSWSPDGSALVLAWGTGIYRIRADGSGRERIAIVPGTRDELIHPRWSPDGRQILFAKQEGNFRWSIWVMNPDGTDRHRVVARAAANVPSVDPAWRSG